MDIRLTKQAAKILAQAFDVEGVTDRIVRINVFSIKDLVTYELSSIEREEITPDDVEISTEYGIYLVYRKPLANILKDVTIGYKIFEDGASFIFFK